MKSKTIVKIIIVIMALGLLGYIVYLTWFASGANQLQYGTSTEPVACTMEAKLCPDGSYVGRSGPKCEFAPCPATTTVGWKTMRDTKTGLSFQYPEKLDTTYISVVDWPPQIQLLNESFVCTEGGTINGGAGETLKRIINGTEYCVTRESEGAAGSIYNQYAYAFPRDGQTLIFTFSLRETQCGNYPEPQKTECETERQSFTIDPLVGQIAKTIQVK